ncbi:cupin domain-containing protein [Actinomadura sp. BRA 177]|uniref:cupin domain-containing protein n=1 Tax=Actinomadura sp. BRA 177 TaxID=2745202 RepID=UPI0015961101|nr:cupin domain-containing protein [Actinomadura sp. BRA 177]NVI92765.1 hypothetical protein [Actinomadura sp. BRA 177]
MITHMPRDLEWHPYTIPGSAPQVELARLRANRETGSFLALVRFPAGWARPGSGHYRCGEEFTVLEGELQVSGVTYRAGDAAWIPAGRERHDSRSDAGAMALAWFSGPAEWVPAPG